MRIKSIRTTLFIILLISLFYTISSNSGKISVEQDEQIGYGNAYDGAETSDGGYVFIGSISNSPSPQVETWMVKTDSEGNPVWTKTYDLLFGSFEVAPDGGFVILGTNDEGKSLTKTNQNGDIIWSKNFGNSDTIDNFFVMSDGGFFLTGAAEWGPLFADDLVSAEFRIVKLDSNGEIKWNKTYFNDLENPTADYVFESNTGGSIVKGTIPYSGTILLLEIDNDGEILRETTLQTTFYGLGKTIQTSDDGLLMIDLNTTAANVGSLKLNKNWEVEWQKDYPGLEGCVWGLGGISEVELGDFIVTSYCQDKEVWAAKLVYDGQMEWIRRYVNAEPDPGPGDQFFRIRKSFVSSDGGLILIGTLSFNTESKFWMMKTDSTGEILWSHFYVRLESSKTTAVSYGYAIVGFTLTQYKVTNPEQTDEELELPDAKVFGLGILMLLIPTLGVYGTYRVFNEEIKLSKNVKNVVKEIFNGKTGPFLVLGRKFSKHNDVEGIFVHPDFPPELLKERFLTHPVRLAICKILSTETKISSSELRARLDIPWGELANHTKSLKDKLYIHIDDEFVDNNVRQIISITNFGLRKYQIFVNLLKDFLETGENQSIEGFPNKIKGE